MSWTEREKRFLLVIAFLSLMLLSAAVYIWSERKTSADVSPLSGGQASVLPVPTQSELPPVEEAAAKEDWAADVKGAVLHPGE